jgi:serine/threonine-protein kinase HipA
MKPADKVFEIRDTQYLWWLGEPDLPRFVGELSLASGGRAVALEYSEEWLGAGFPLSEDLPLAPGLFVPEGKDAVAGAVDDARPDRWGERVIRKFEKSPRLSLLEYLLFAGDDRYGALSVSSSPDCYQPWLSAPVPSLANLEAISEVVRKVLANEPVPELQKRLVRPGVSLGGVRPKSVVEIDGHPWLVKFSEGEEMDTQLVEHATMTLARSCGISVAQTRALPVRSGHAVAIRRFDREAGRRIHAISAFVALRAAGEQLGYPQFAQLLRRHAAAGTIAGQQSELFRRMVFNILVDNTDDHEKNHALLLDEDGTYMLSPAFDVVPAAQGLGYQAMQVGDAGSEASLENALSQCAAFGLARKSAETIVREVARGVDRWKEHFRAAGVTAADVRVLAQYIDGPRLGEARKAALRGRRKA